MTESTESKTESIENTTDTVATGGDTLKLVVTTGDGSSTDDKIPLPWLNRVFATNLMFRSLFLADSDLQNVAMGKHLQQMML